MSHFLCIEKYRLELHWDSIDYLNDSIATLKNARFNGPVLNDAAQIQAPDHIDLDMTSQLVSVVEGFYIIRLSWDAVEYEGREVFLKGARLENQYLKEFHKILDNDSITINTEKHEESTHAYNLVYESTIVRANKEPYKYRKD